VHILFSWPAIITRRVWRYQRGNQNPYIEEEQTTQWPNEKAQKDKQRSAKHAHKTKDRVTRIPLKIGGEIRCSGRVSSYCSTGGTIVTCAHTPFMTSHYYNSILLKLCDHIHTKVVMNAVIDYIPKIEAELNNYR
jgi:hypothetical protein